MTSHVISHRSPRRKRGKRSLALRRSGAFAITIAALAASSWLAPYLFRAPPAPAVIAEAPMPSPKPAPPPAPAKLVLAQAPEPQPQPPRARAARARTVPLDADTAAPAEDFEILSASELDAISQAAN